MGEGGGGVITIVDLGRLKLLLTSRPYNPGRVNGRVETTYSGPGPVYTNLCGAPGPEGRCLHSVRFITFYFSFTVQLGHVISLHDFLGRS